MSRPRHPDSYYEDIKRKFAEERDLRLAYRPEGTQQFTSEFDGELAKYGDRSVQRTRRAARSDLATRSKCCSSAADFRRC